MEQMESSGPSQQVNRQPQYNGKDSEKGATGGLHWGGGRGRGGEREGLESFKRKSNVYKEEKTLP